MLTSLLAALVIALLGRRALQPRRRRTARGRDYAAPWPTEGARGAQRPGPRGAAERPAPALRDAARLRSEAGSR